MNAIKRKEQTLAHHRFDMICSRQSDKGYYSGSPSRYDLDCVIEAHLETEIAELKAMEGAYSEKELDKYSELCDDMANAIDPVTGKIARCKG